MVSAETTAKLALASNRLLKVAGVVGAIVVLINAANLYINNYYVPKVFIVKSEYDKGKATVKYRKTTITMVGEGIYSIMGTWGVKIGSTTIDGVSKYDRVELLKNGMVYDYLKIA